MPPLEANENSHHAATYLRTLASMEVNIYIAGALENAATDIEQGHHLPVVDDDKQESDQ